MAGSKDVKTKRPGAWLAGASCFRSGLRRADVGQIRLELDVRLDVAVFLEADDGRFVLSSVRRGQPQPPARLNTIEGR